MHKTENSIPLRQDPSSLQGRQSYEVLFSQSGLVYFLLKLNYPNFSITSPFRCLKSKSITLGDTYQPEFLILGRKEGREVKLAGDTAGSKIFPNVFFQGRVE